MWVPWLRHVGWRWWLHQCAMNGNHWAVVQSSRVLVLLSFIFELLEPLIWAIPEPIGESIADVVREEVNDEFQWFLWPFMLRLASFGWVMELLRLILVVKEPRVLGLILRKSKCGRWSVAKVLTGWMVFLRHLFFIPSSMAKKYFVKHSWPMYKSNY